VLAPEGNKVKVTPAQVVPLFTVITGKGLTETLEMAGLEETQPSEFVPVTEYVVLTRGETVLLPPE
jgi:hypothetical protein